MAVRRKKKKVPAKSGPKGPSLMTPRLVSQICRYLKRGNTEDDSARLANLNTRTYWLWKTKGNRDLEEGTDSDYSQFVLRVEKAKSHVIDEQVEKITQSSDWRSSAFFLERRRPENWAKTEKHQHQVTGSGGGPIQLEVESKTLQLILSDDQAMEALAILADRTAALALLDMTSSDDGEEEDDEG